MGGSIRVIHREFLAQIEPDTYSCSVFREPEDLGGLRSSLRVALRARLPLDGGLPLHAAGVEVGGRGVVFFGPSGAGKTTLASLCPWRVLADELVAVAGHPFQLWGIDDRLACYGAVPLLALFELAKGPETRCERLAPQTAVRRLLDVALVPAQTGLWNRGLAVLGLLASTVPVFRLEWSTSRPPWAAIEATLERLSGAKGWSG